MAAKIVLFLSDLKEGASERTYDCPSGEPVTGAQTNDAPVRYLLREHPLVRQVICVVTQLARQSAWEHFQAVVHDAAPAAEVVAVDCEEQQDFSQTVIPLILPLFRKDDEIFLDLTGGFRNANMHLLLLSRVLSYCGISTAGAVYSNFRTGRVEDMSHLFGEFDLVAGMQELTNLGSVRTLRAYYAAHPTAPEIDELLDSMEALTEAITLCRTKRIGELMARFGAALEAAERCDDPLMQQLLTAFRQTFGKKLSTPSLIKWCLRNDMLQQALTVYTERIPAYIFSGVVMMGSQVRQVEPLAYEDDSTAQFMHGFLRMSSYYHNKLPKKTYVAVDLPAILREYVRQHADDILACRSGQEHDPVPDSIRTGVENILLVMDLSYPGESGYQPDWTDRLPPEKQHLAMLSDRLGTLPAHTAKGMLNNVVTFSRTLLWALLEQPDDSEPQHNVRAMTIHHLDKLLPGSGYTTSYPLEQLQAICRDYLYVKLLRNLANHANDEVNEEQISLMDYLSRFGYPDPEAITADELKQLLECALSNLRSPQKKEKKK